MHTRAVFMLGTGTRQIYTVITSALDIDVYKETYEWQGSFQDSLELEVSSLKTVGVHIAPVARVLQQC